MALSVTDHILETNFGLNESNGKQLPESTRLLAARALSGEFGLQMREAQFDVDKVDSPSPDMAYAEAIRSIAEHAPLRIIPGAWVVGSATLLEAAKHTTPACDFGGTSHTTPGFDKALKLGYRGIRESIVRRLARVDVRESGKRFLESCMQCIDAAGIWHRRYMKELESTVPNESAEKSLRRARVLRTLEHVPENPPRGQCLEMALIVCIR